VADSPPGHLNRFISLILCFLCLHPRSIRSEICILQTDYFLSLDSAPPLSLQHHHFPRCNRYLHQCSANHLSMVAISLLFAAFLLFCLFHRTLDLVDHLPQSGFGEYLWCFALTFLAFRQNRLEIFGLLQDTLGPKSGEPDI